MSNLEYGFLCTELSPLLIGKRLDKFYELDDGKFRISFGSLDLVAELSKRMNTTKYIEKSPEKPSDFAMGVRKYLDGAKITSFSQHGTDRIITIGFEKRMGDQSVKFSFIFEMFAKGNLILTDEVGKIVRSYKREEGKDRLIKTGVPYAYPAPSALSQIPSESELKKILADVAVSSSLSKLPLGTLYVKEALARTGIDAKRKGSELSASEISALSKAIREIVERAKPIVYMKDGAPAEFALASISSFSSYEPVPAASLNEAADEFFFANRDATEEQNKTNPELEAKIEKAKLRLEKQNEHLISLEKEMKECDAAGKAIYDNFETIERVLVAAKAGDELALARLGAKQNKKEGTVTVEL